MQRNPFIFLLLLFLALAIRPAEARGHRVKIELEPRRISPGDPFLLRVTGRLAAPPEASFNGSPLVFSPCGGGCYLAVGATDRDAPPGRYRIRGKIARKAFIRTVTVQKSSFPSISLALPEDKVSPSEEDLLRIEREAYLLNDLWQVVSDRQWEGPFSLPLQNELSTAYGVERLMNGSRVSVHRGLDVKGEEGEEVLASNSGTVALAEPLFFGGNTLVIDHGGGIYTVYMHLAAFCAAAGDSVSKGTVIGYVGQTGRATGPHLHFGVKVGRISVNPTSFLKLKL